MAQDRQIATPAPCSRPAQPRCRGSHREGSGNAMRRAKRPESPPPGRPSWRTRQSPARHWRSPTRPPPPTRLPQQQPHARVHRGKDARLVRAFLLRPHSHTPFLTGTWPSHSFVRRPRAAFPSMRWRQELGAQSAGAGPARRRPLLCGPTDVSTRRALRPRGRSGPPGREQERVNYVMPIAAIGRTPVVDASSRASCRSSLRECGCPGLLRAGACRHPRLLGHNADGSDGWEPAGKSQHPIGRIETGNRSRC